MRLFKASLLIVGAALLVAGCAGSPQKWQPTEKQRQAIHEASMQQAMKMQAYPMDADMENFDEQARLMVGGMYLTWTGEYKQLPAAFEENTKKPIKPQARYVQESLGQYRSLDTGSPVDIMK